MQQRNNYAQDPMNDSHVSNGIPQTKRNLLNMTQKRNDGSNPTAQIVGGNGNESTALATRRIMIRWSGVMSAT